VRRAKVKGENETNLFLVVVVLLLMMLLL